MYVTIFLQADVKTNVRIYSLQLMRYNLNYLALDDSCIPVLILMQYFLSSHYLNHMKFKCAMYIIIYYLYYDQMLNEYNYM